MLRGVLEAAGVRAVDGPLPISLSVATGTINTEALRDGRTKLNLTEVSFERVSPPSEATAGEREREAGNVGN